MFLTHSLPSLSGLKISSTVSLSSFISKVFKTSLVIHSASLHPYFLNRNNKNKTNTQPVINTEPLSRDTQFPFPSSTGNLNRIIYPCSLLSLPRPLTPLKFTLQRTSTASKVNICAFFSPVLHNHSLEYFFIKSYNPNCSFLAFFPDSFTTCLAWKCWDLRILSLKLFSILPGYSGWFPEFHQSIRWWF